MMTIADALPMLMKGKSLGEVQKTAERRKKEERPANVVSLAAVRATRIRHGIQTTEPVA